MLHKVDDIRPPVRFPALVFGQGIADGFESPARRSVVRFCRVTGRLPIGVKLPDEGHFLRQGDTEVIEFKHSLFSTLFVEGLRILRDPQRVFKINVPFLFSCENKQKRIQFLRSLFRAIPTPIELHINNHRSRGVHNPRLFFLKSSSKIVQNRNIGKLLHTVFPTAIHGGDF